MSDYYPLPGAQPTGRFPLGQLVATAGVAATLASGDVASAIERHARGDWGNLTPADREANELALKDGSRLLSAYVDRNGVKFWVITEADRSVTIVLLPDEY